MHLLLLFLPFGASDSTMKSEVSYFGDVGLSIQEVGYQEFLTGYEFSIGGIKPITKEFGILNHKIQTTFSFVSYSTIHFPVSYDEENSKILKNNKETGYVFGLNYGFSWYFNINSISPYLEIGTGINYLFIPEWSQKRRSFQSQNEYDIVLYSKRKEISPIFYFSIGLIELKQNIYAITLGLKSIFVIKNNAKLELFSGFYW